MSWLDRVRGVWLGTPQEQQQVDNRVKQLIEQKRSTIQEGSLEERVESLDAKVQEKEHEVKKFESKALECLQRGDDVGAKSFLAQKNKATSERNILQQQYVNARAQLDAQQRAQSHLHDAVLLEQGAEQLKVTTEAVDQVDLTGAINTMRMANEKMEMQTQMLTMPILSGTNTVVEQYKVDEELEALKAKMMPVFPEVPQHQVGAKEPLKKAN